MRPEDFDSLYQRYHQEVWALIYARWLDKDLALDITQETFLRLWKQNENGDAIQNPRAWLLRVAKNLAEDHHKSAFHRNGTLPPELMNGIRSKGDLPLEQIVEEEQFAQVRKYLASMTEGDREILTLRYALEYDVEKIAELLEVNVAAVHMRLSRARQRLADKMSIIHRH